jgi:lipoprotein-anchoring transpeptidase ErfK/SrfK
MLLYFGPNSLRNCHEKSEVMIWARFGAMRCLWIAVAVAGAALVLAAGFLLAVNGPGAPGALASRSAGAPAAARRGTPPRGDGVTAVATLRFAVPRYTVPGGRSSGVVAASWYDRASVLPVIATRPGWVEVRLAQRPNGSTGWIPAGDVTLGSTPYRIVIDLSTLHLSLYDAGRLVFSAPAGVGAPGDPTPVGEFFVAFDEPPPQTGVGYGPFVLVTSAHSPTISDWDGSGDAVIGIHGPLGMDAEIGIKGARISHGCVRLHVAALEKLSGVPPGTPIDITG